MNILVINASPKGNKSNTYQITSAFLEGIKQQNANINIEEMSLYNKNMHPCLGCFSCWNKTPGKCVLNDDMKEILPKLLSADIIIWSFPLYYYNVPGPLKTFMDRQLPLSLPFMAKDTTCGGHPSRYENKPQKHIVISTCGFYTTKENYDAVNAMFDHVLGKDQYETIYCAQGELFRVPELKAKTNAYLEVAKRAGEEYINGKITKSTKDKLNQLLFPRETFEAMADASWGIENETGEIQDDSYIFTKQMAALYNPNSYSKDIVLEMEYVDLHKTYQIIINKDGYKVIKEDFLPYTTKIETPFTVWCDIATDKISGEDALMKQLYKVHGDFDLMIHWDHYFGNDSEHDETPTQKKTNMSILLLPWIIFWVSTSTNTFFGSLITIAACSMVSLFFYKNEKTIYDILSSVIVTLLSLSLLITNKITFILPLSYLLFGLIWSISCLFKIPLTAYYSCNDYNGKQAFKNPLFIKTNQILTLMWGILYIFTSIMTFFLTKSNLSSYLPIINNILPIFMGIFTIWFQKWYPKKIAKGK